MKKITALTLILVYLTLSVVLVGCGEGDGSARVNAELWGECKSSRGEQMPVWMAISAESTLVDTDDGLSLTVYYREIDDSRLDGRLDTRCRLWIYFDGDKYRPIMNRDGLSSKNYKTVVRGDEKYTAFVDNIYLPPEVFSGDGGEIEFWSEFYSTENKEELNTAPGTVSLFYLNSDGKTELFTDFCEYYEKKTDGFCAAVLQSGTAGNDPAPPLWVSISANSGRFSNTDLPTVSFAFNYFAFADGVADARLRLTLEGSGGYSVLIGEYESYVLADGLTEDVDGVVINGIAVPSDCLVGENGYFSIRVELTTVDEHGDEVAELSGAGSLYFLKEDGMIKLFPTENLLDKYLESIS